ncbi:50S ribosomal protein L32 [bacterium (Candidatus Gribaldobacteria) CG07_land_8_20_14_0_80_33_18]|uniref:Large ribosomal subunit protein bL32 n=1 Tax=bacterium (Candidatus Gribaldobacteria) CG07_land_8_20_14_0_80_33_18 TaxID=2014272 RepID=A0A2M6Z1Y8_9BACT|nr:MAG: 50S ribosomal protein L32 [bacterium (Candidatus Gribaldobacteria) CG10_big_fil_rev_8_21_14_0_10_33_41]PIU46372.1 MAG: 50S ribosomal protein L32 [bacterium (Candidatus Gribaldobacteria) CG07_land_8_20_14_0_80_33_18]PJA00644.1 MAG: 50S ribosomal protein L32 [bacterium (Candidatus Gribaldobacteria) CG_4_10_14_0_2_um_filter_33_15]PJB08469.1 MAG: 50S ribosomal protein L32 [bacterium (Candidatus Gribaldobacteria) CG_4_9_14_3_um_filter_33_9]
MGVPKHRGTKSKRNKRRIHIFLETPTLVTCPKCGKSARPHTVCSYCGFYKGVEVINVLKKLEKKEKKKREKEIKEKEKGAGKEKPLTLEELSKKKF